MDIHCRHCGEPWDHDELHNMEGDVPYKEAAKLFSKYGCTVMVYGDWPPLLTCKHIPIYPPEMLELIGQSQDMSPYPDEWSSPDDIEMMLEIAEEMF